MNRFPKTILTPQGKKKLEAELAGLRAKRPQIVAEVQRARALGDLRENSAYQANKDKMRQTDRRITELELLLRHSEVIEKTNTKEVQLGSKIKAEFNNQKVVFELVGESEADPKMRKISLHSPLGKAFLGRQKNDMIEVKTPGGKSHYKILQIN
jgi:transcription elongation factor GreA